jgi:hypothetical protein
MKKRMLSLAAMCAVLSFASPAQAELKFSGDATIRPRLDSPNTTSGGVETTINNDLKWTYRVRLKAAADLGNGYFFKALLQDENIAPGVVPGWSTVDGGAAGLDGYKPAISQFYFGRMMQNSHYMAGRLPLNSLNNPIFDLALYPIPAFSEKAGTMLCAVDVPVLQWNFDRIFAANYGFKLGEGDLNATLVVLDNHSGPKSVLLPGYQTERGLLNDSYALHLSYKTNLGKVTFEPQALLVLTDGSGLNYQNVSPNTFGANLAIPVASKSKLSFSGFYTYCKDKNGYFTTPDLVQHPVTVDYSGYLLRAKIETGPVTAWVDYNRTQDKTTGGYYFYRITSAGAPVLGTINDAVYNNIFVWAQYKFNVYESAAGTFSLTPTIRYRATSFDPTGSFTDRNNLFRTELWATVTF